MNYRQLAFALCVLSGLAAEDPGRHGPALTPTGPAEKAAKVPAYKSVLVQGVPHLRQEPDFCGEACAAMYLQKLGLKVGQHYVFDQSGLDPLEGRGCCTKELAAALTNIGFKTGQVWYRIPAARLAEDLEAQWKTLHADLAAGIPSIVCTHYDKKPKTTEHFRLILGYDAKTDEALYHEPAEAAGAHRRMKRADLLALWPLKYEAGQSTVIRLRLEPGAQLSRGVCPRPASGTFTPADFAQHVMVLKKKIPSDDFTVMIQPPFVVIGDEPPEDVKRRAVGTVKWAVDRLQEAYFSKDPAEILDIWLFKDDESYRKHCKSVFHTTPDTPYGYFSHAERALVMNIGTGGGTLVHEIVHPFVAANFPECPAWFNEGLGSLYEQAGEENGEICGYTNWRLVGKNGLQEAIRKKKTVSFKTLCSTTTEEFYNEDKGTNYSQARYLCYYLQQCGLLRKFYHAFYKNRGEDPTGYKTLQAVLRRDDMDVFQKEWEAWVLKLKYR